MSDEEKNGINHHFDLFATIFNTAKENIASGNSHGKC